MHRYARLISCWLILLLLLPVGANATAFAAPADIQQQTAHHHAHTTDSTSAHHACCPMQAEHEHSAHSCPPGSCPCVCGCEVSALLSVVAPAQHETVADFQAVVDTFLPVKPAELLRPPRFV